MTGRSRLGFVAMTARVVRAVTHRPALGSRLGKHTADDISMRVRVGVEGRESHEENKEHGTRQREWRVVKEEATAVIAVSPKGLHPRSRRSLHGHADAASATVCVSDEYPRRTFLDCC
jgi:hypothetical protein